MSPYGLVKMSGILTCDICLHRDDYDATAAAELKRKRTFREYFLSLAM